MNNLTEEEIAEAVMNYPGGCDSGKKEFLKTVFDIVPKPKLHPTEYRITLFSEDDAGLSPEKVALLLHEGILSRSNRVEAGWRDSANRPMAIKISRGDDLPYGFDMSSNKFIEWARNLPDTDV